MLTFSDNKAGMSGLDKDKITKIITENTSASYSNFSQKKQQKLEERIKEIKSRLESATAAERASAQKSMDEMMEDLESERDLTRHYVCVDMDAYFAAVEMRDDPRLRTIPMAVGSTSMLSTSNYLARKFGVRAAMPGFIAKKLCPELELVPGNYKKYSKVSREFSQIFAEYDPDMSMGSLDEAYIDITEFVEERREPRKISRKRFGGDCICRLPIIKPEEITESLEGSKITEKCAKCQKERIIYEDLVEFGVGRAEIVREMRFRVEQATGLTCSAGIASTFRLAKICSDFNKPNGQFELPNDRQEILHFLKDLPIRKVSGIGRVSEAHLQACGISTVGDMLEKRAIFPLVFSLLSQESFLRTALGLRGRPSSGDPKRKSVSVERTFGGTSDENLLKDEHRQICEYLFIDLGKNGIRGGKTITLKLKLASFDVLTRSLTPGKLITSLEDIYGFSMELLAKELGQEIRLIGVRLSQLTFLDEENQEVAKKTQKSVVEFWNEAKRKRRELAESDDFRILTTSSENPTTSCVVPTTHYIAPMTSSTAPFAFYKMKSSGDLPTSSKSPMTFGARSTSSRAILTPSKASPTSSGKISSPSKAAKSSPRATYRPPFMYIKPTSSAASMSSVGTLTSSEAPVTSSRAMLMPSTAPTKCSEAPTSPKVLFSVPEADTSSEDLFSSPPALKPSGIIFAFPTDPSPSGDLFTSPPAITSSDDLFTSPPAQTSSGDLFTSSEALPTSSNTEKVPCPICSLQLPNDDVIVNRHVDECLNKGLLYNDVIIPKKTSTSPKKMLKNKKAKKTVTKSSIEKFLTDFHLMTPFPKLTSPSTALTSGRRRLPVN
ncbi:unnamed protein product [Caenorhabditis auriculariae]|uniref:DNA polymerase kappa n=1 Tax=Caenorhabditis auriculariae TaxID=2777116 RepID=A0A8S1H8J7_9PELO|nr:unnamed protein product [Caenorhabditis auriculariae]